MKKFILFLFSMLFVLGMNAGELKKAERGLHSQKKAVNVMRTTPKQKLTPVKRAPMKTADGTIITDFYMYSSGKTGFYFGWSTSSDEMAGFRISLFNGNNELIVTVDYAKDDEYMYSEEANSWFYIADYLMYDAIEGGDDYVSIVGPAYEKNVVVEEDEFLGNIFNSYNLIAGSYSILIQPIDANGNIIDEGIRESISLNTFDVTNLVLTLSGNGKQVTATFDAPTTLPEGAYVYLEVITGAQLVASTTEAKSPFVFEVEEGNMYEVYVAVYDAEDNLLGEYVDETIQVGENKFAPKDLKAEVNEKEVTLSWSANNVAEYYWITVYDENDVAVVDDYVEESATSVTITLNNGKYTWTVQAYETDGYYLYALSSAVDGPAFEVKADINAQIVECDNAGVYSDYFSNYGIMLIEMYNEEENIGVSAAIYTDEASVPDGIYSDNDLMFSIIYPDWANLDDEGFEATTAKVTVTSDNEFVYITIEAVSDNGNFVFNGKIVKQSENSYAEPQEKSEFNIVLKRMNVDTSDLAQYNILDIEFISETDDMVIVLEQIAASEPEDMERPIAAGKYTFLAEPDYGEFYAGEILDGYPLPAYLAVFDPNANDFTFYYMVSGSIIVTNENGVYSIVIDATTENGSTIHAIYSVVATGVESVEKNNLDFNQDMYNVLGQKVGKNYRGIIVQKGHKYIVR